MHLPVPPRTRRVKRAPRCRDGHLITDREVRGEGVKLQQKRRMEEWMVRSLRVKSGTLLDPTALCECSDTHSLLFSALPCQRVRLDFPFTPVTAEPANHRLNYRLEKRWRGRVFRRRIRGRGPGAGRANGVREARTRGIIRA